MRNNILQELFEEVVRRLVKGLQPEQIILFGSYAYGHPEKGSDLDVMIIVSESDDPAHRRALRAYECVGAVGVPKDSVVLTHELLKRR